MSSSTQENYLKSIYGLADALPEGKRVPFGQVAEKLGVAGSTVTTMMKQLGEKELVDYQPHHGVRLTEAGRLAALNVIRRHRLVELFLVEVMQMDLADVHREAELLEHAMSERLTDRIDEMLGFPALDPHGDPIPRADGSMVEFATLPLSECQPDTYVVSRTLDTSPEFLQWMKQHDVKIGTQIDISARDDVAGTLLLELPTGPTPIGLQAAAKVLVRSPGD